MKPIIIFEIDGDAYDPDRAKEFDDYLTSIDLSKRYDMIVLYGAHAKVYYPCKSLMFYYHKLKIWLTRKTLKKFTS